MWTCDALGNAPAVGVWGCRDRGSRNTTIGRPIRYDTRFQIKLPSLLSFVIARIAEISGLMITVAFQLVATCIPGSNVSLGVIKDEKPHQL